MAQKTEVIVDEVGDAFRERLKVRMYESKYLADKCLVSLRISEWSGSKVVTDEEFQDIHANEEWLANRTKGTRSLVRKEALEGVKGVIRKIEALMSSVSCMSLSIPTLYVVSEGDLDALLITLKSLENDFRIEVERFLENNYETEKEWSSRVSAASSPSMSTEFFDKIYPSKSYVRAAYKLSASVVKSPASLTLSQLADEYQTAKLDEAVKSAIKATRETLLAATVRGITSLRGQISKKEKDSVINNKSIRSLGETLDKIENLSSQLGTFSDVSIEIATLRSKLGELDTRTVAEAEGLELPTLLDNILLKAESFDDEKHNNDIDKMLLRLEQDEMEESGMLASSAFDPAVERVVQDKSEVEEQI